ncbi:MULTISPECIES: hypothetical protein [unclassified Cupriavidus]|uniref:hypothetical protein n=1 Tax=unclassified Cupriavidus TaxID=2640874 RepID=UPI001BFFE9B9|nr:MULTISPECIES: hypothetical protein [unclassified Cupriavidus]MCA3188324.1 hypothetical protein [Cupriavidus sp.]MCA3189822.1 hypothetical protein [Cupriavidus sp.]MCA3196416.1 hypothetical protein [Cupriavidus sp.]MCA3202161.1 hypothetical protein [Cupriavidus sp.]MCA3232183.1 hypothetical protein [Cupriavidus sp.]
MATEVSVCSNALQILGAKPINSFEEKTEQARLCANLWPDARDELLRAHPWKAAKKRVILAPLTTAPAFDYGYAFELPGDWLKTLQVGKRGQAIDYETEGRTILASVTALPLVYIYRNDVVQSWHPHLVSLAELLMCARMAYAVTKSTSVRESHRDEFARALKVAKAIDGQDDPPEEFEEGSLLESRFTTR